MTISRSRLAILHSITWALLVCVANPAAAQEEQLPPVTIELGGELRPRAEARTNHHFGHGPDHLYHRLPDTADQISQRARLGASVRHQQWSALLQIQYASLWGTTGGAELTDPSLGIHQAWLRYTATDWLSIQAGRFEIAYGDQRVLGNVGWHQLGRAWDGLRASIGPFAGVNLDGFVLQYRVYQSSPGRPAWPAGDIVR